MRADWLRNPWRLLTRDSGWSRADSQVARPAVSSPGHLPQASRLQPPSHPTDDPPATRTHRVWTSAFLFSKRLLFKALSV